MHSPDKKIMYLQLLLVALLAITVNANVLSNEFVYDDNVYLVNDTRITSIKYIPEIFSRDITRLDMAEQSLGDARAMTRNLNDIINRSPVMVFQWKMAEGRPVVYASDNVWRLGYTAQDFIDGVA